MDEKPETYLPICVFDTGVVLQAALNPTGAAGRAFLLIEGFLLLYLSPRLRSEMEEVLFRPSLRAKFSQLTDEHVLDLLGRLDAASQFVPNPPIVFSLPRDRKDEPIINLAIHVNADYLVSRDRDLLDLNTDAAFKKTYPTLETLDPVAFCAAMNV